jgi:hypothetical protein
VLVYGLPVFHKFLERLLQFDLQLVEVIDHIVIACAKSLKYGKLGIEVSWI